MGPPTEEEFFSMSIISVTNTLAVVFASDGGIELRTKGQGDVEVPLYTSRHPSLRQAFRLN